MSIYTGGSSESSYGNRSLSIESREHLAVPPRQAPASSGGSDPGSGLNAVFCGGSLEKVGSSSRHSEHSDSVLREDVDLDRDLDGGEVSRAGMILLSVEDDENSLACFFFDWVDPRCNILN